MRFVTTAAVVVFGCALVGCVAQADYDQLMVLNKSLGAEKEAALQRALDAETQADAHQNQLRIKERELAMQEALVANLRGENEQLDQAFASVQDLMKKVDLTPDRPLIIQTHLPAALDSALKSFDASHPNAVEYDPSRGVVKWKSDLLFASGSDVVREDAKSTLRSFADVVNTVEANNFDIVVVGHTDNDPIVHSRAKHPSNWHLSSHRAIAVARELLQAQINPARMGVMGYGEYRPFVSNDSDQSKVLNRRVEIYISGRSGVAQSPATDDTAAQTKPKLPEPQK